MALVQKTETFDFTVIDPDSGDEVTVYCRRLNALDEAALRDSMAVQVDEEGETTAAVRIGTWQLLSVQRAVVRWDSPGDPPPSPDAIAALHPDVFDAIYAKMEEEGGAPKPPEREDEDEPEAGAAETGVPPTVPQEPPTPPLAAAEAPVEPRPAPSADEPS